MPRKYEHFSSYFREIKQIIYHMSNYIPKKSLKSVFHLAPWCSIKILWAEVVDGEGGDSDISLKWGGIFPKTS